MTPLIKTFLENNFNATAYASIEMLAGGGGARKYYRFNYENQTYILTESLNVTENHTFVYFTNHFLQTIKNLPKVDAISDDFTLYVQQDLGNTTLLDCLLTKGEGAKKYYIQSIQQLAKMQVLGNKGLDYSKGFSYPNFNNTLVLRDLFYFKNYFLNVLEIEFNHSDLLLDFERFSNDFSMIKTQYFCYRDFQARNIMVKNNEPYFIDYQGGLKGPLQYDVVSLLWQAKANLTGAWKNELYNVYINELNQLINFNKNEFKKGYELCLIERLLQVLGAYGFRGLIQKKSHFIESISFALKNLEQLLTLDTLNNYSTLKKIVQQLTKPTVLQTINKIIHEPNTKH